MISWEHVNVLCSRGQGLVKTVSLSVSDTLRCSSIYTLCSRIFFCAYLQTVKIYGNWNIPSPWICLFSQPQIQSVRKTRVLGMLVHIPSNCLGMKVVFVHIENLITPVYLLVDWWPPIFIGKGVPPSEPCGSSFRRQGNRQKRSIGSVRMWQGL